LLVPCAEDHSVAHSRLLQRVKCQDQNRKVKVCWSLVLIMTSCSDLPSGQKCPWLIDVRSSSAVQTDLYSTGINPFLCRQGVQAPQENPWLITVSLQS